MFTRKPLQHGCEPHAGDPLVPIDMTAPPPPPPRSPADANTTTRLAWIDHLRVVGCLAVIAVHVSGQAYSRFSDPPSFEWWLANVLNGSCRAAVPVFVMISGALIKPSDCDAVAFYRKKAGRFLPIIVVWTLCYGLFDVIIKGQTPQQVVGDFLTYGHVYLHLWFLTMFAGLLSVVPFIAKLRFGLAGPARDWLILAGIATVLITIQSTMRFTEVAFNFTFLRWTHSFLEYIPYFLLGAVLNGSPGQPASTRWGWLLTLALIASWTANYLTCRCLGIVSDYVPLSNTSPLVMAVALTVFLFIRSRVNQSVRSPRWLVLLGNATLGIYLIHPLFIWLFRRLLRGTNIDILSGPWMLLDLPVIFGVSLGATLLIRRFALGRKIC